MKTLKKFSAFLLTFVMMISLISVLNFTGTIKSDAAESGDYVYEVFDENDKTCEIIEYLGSDSFVTIPSTLGGYSVVSIGMDAFYNCSDITSVTVPNTVQFIQAWAFDSCISLESVTIPDSVQDIGQGAFFGCSSLTSINIPASVEIIEPLSFSGCYQLTDINVDSKNPAFSSSDGILFNQGKTALCIYPCGKTDETYTVPGTVQTIWEGAFFDCYNLTSITIPASVQIIEPGAFANCNELTTITVDNNNSEFSSLDGVLFDKDKTTLCTYPQGKTAETYTIPNGVQIISECAFFNCINLVSVKLPESIKAIEDAAFYHCESIKSVTIPDGAQSIGWSSFEGCVSLTSIFIPDSIQFIDVGAFFDCISLTIYGTKGSYAEQYAIENNIPFAEYDPNLGDVNNDGNITLNDAMLIINDVAKKEPLTDEFKTNADVDADGNITLNDAMYIINYVAKKTDIVGPQKPVSSVFTMGNMSITLPEGFTVIEEQGFPMAINPDFPNNPDNVVFEQGPVDDVNLYTKEELLASLTSVFPDAEITNFERTQISGIDTIKTSYNFTITDPETSIVIPISQSIIIIFDTDTTYSISTTSFTGVYDDAINAALDTITVNK